MVTLQGLTSMESFTFRMSQPRQLQFQKNAEIQTITLKLIRITTTSVQFQITELNGANYPSDSNPVWSYRLTIP